MPKKTAIDMFTVIDNFNNADIGWRAYVISPSDDRNFFRCIVCPDEESQYEFPRGCTQRATFDSVQIEDCLRHSIAFLAGLHRGQTADILEGL